MRRRSSAAGTDLLGRLGNPGASMRVCRSKRRKRWGRPPATGLQEQVANYRKRRGSKAQVVSVTEKAPQGVRWETGRRTPVTYRANVENRQVTSKPVGLVTPGSVWTTPAYGPDGVRHRGRAILFQALTLNRGNLRGATRPGLVTARGAAKSGPRIVVASPANVDPSSTS